MHPNVTAIEKVKVICRCRVEQPGESWSISVSADASPEDVQTIRMATINVSVLILFYTIWVVFSITNGGNPYLNGINALTLVAIIGCFIGGFVQKHPQFLKSLSCCTALHGFQPYYWRCRLYYSLVKTRATMFTLPRTKYDYMHP